MLKTFNLFLILFICYNVVQAQPGSDQIDSLIQKYVENGQFMGSVVIVDNNRLILSKGYGYANLEWEIPNTPDTRFRIASITKQFTCLLVMKFAEMGMLSLDQTICDFIPFYPDEPGKRIKIKHLLSHTSGLRNYTDGEMARDSYPRDQFIKEFCMHELKFEPGTRYSYSNTGYYLLGDILERVSGKSFEELLREYIFGPAGMDQSGIDDGYRVVTHKADSYMMGIKGPVNADKMSSQDMGSIVFSAGYIYSTVNDMLKFDRAITDNLLLTAPATKEMLKRVAKLTSADVMRERNPLLFDVLGASYSGYFGDIFIKIDENTGDSTICYQHNGGINMFRSHNYSIPSKGRYLVVLGNNGSEKGDEIIWKSLQILDGKKAGFPRNSLISAMQRAFREDGITAMLKVYSKYRNDINWEVNERQLNSLAYSMIRANMVDEATEIFRLVTDDWPGSYNAWDSYAEALALKGDTISAIKYYRKSLELNPGSRSGLEAIERLGGKLK